ncbi:sigma factor-like helix-turn-helix DNA-binding protein [Sorangium sp. So ce590]
MLERLTPKERAAYLLHEVFDVSYPEIAATLGIQETTCRKLVSRARANVGQSKVRHTTPLHRQEQLLAAFQTAVASGGTEHLSALLSDEIELCADGGDKVSSLLEVLQGKVEVLDFIGRALHAYWGDYACEATDINGGRGVVLWKDGSAAACVSFAYDEHGAATNIYIVRNPDKLARLGRDGAGGGGQGAGARRGDRANQRLGERRASAVGVTPGTRRMHRAMWLWCANPASIATWLAGRSPRESSAFTRSTRRRTTYSCTGRPVDRWS